MHVTSRKDTSGGSLEPECKDQNAYCSAWADRGYCSNQYLIYNCQLSCNLCPKGIVSLSSFTFSKVIALLSQPYCFTFTFTFIQYTLTTRLFLSVSEKLVTTPKPEEQPITEKITSRDLTERESLTYTYSTPDPSSTGAREY